MLPPASRGPDWTTHRFGQKKFIAHHINLTVYEEGQHPGWYHPEKGQNGRQDMLPSTNEQFHSSINYSIKTACKRLTML